MITVCYLNPLASSIATPGAFDEVGADGFEKAVEVDVGVGA